MYTVEELERLKEEEDSLTDEELLVLLAALHITLSELEKEIRLFFQRYGTDGVITFSEARKWISSKTHIRRLVFLNQTISTLFNAGFDDFEKLFTNHLTNIITKESKFFGVALDADDILNAVWGKDELNWLQRLMAHRTKWTNQLNFDLKVSVLKQDEILDVLKQMTKRGESMETILKRLWRTESNAVSSIARKQAYEKLGITKYQFLHLDKCHCEECSDMDGRVFPVSEYEVGVTANPLHPNCRDITVPVK